MELQDVEIKNGELAIKKYKLFGLGFRSCLEFKPKIILTEQEAKDRKIDCSKLRKGKGYYTEIDGIRVPIIIKN